MQRPQKPTSALVSHYVQEFDAKARWEKDLTDLFRRFPENVQSDHILLKVSVLNAIYSTHIRDVYAVARHIQRLNIDPKLAQRVPELVNEITKSPVGRVYSFATKYCSWHVPDAYPIFDRFVRKLLFEYQQVDKFSEDFRKKDLSADYVAFKRIIEAFRNYYGLVDFSFKDLDKFLLLHSKEYFRKTT
jgi:hypothetical protein